MILTLTGHGVKGYCVCVCMVSRICYAVGCIEQELWLIEHLHDIVNIPVLIVADLGEGGGGVSGVQILPETPRKKTLMRQSPSAPVWVIPTTFNPPFQISRPPLAIGASRRL